MLFVINEILILHSDSSNRKGKLDEYNYPVFAELWSSQSCQHLGTLLGPKKKDLIYLLAQYGSLIKKLMPIKV